ncbi:MAG: hypothetical protein ABI233_08445 [Chthoniobacterales bacterium]
MATKTKKTAAKKTTTKMRDLPAKKNPKGGAQKKETSGSTSSKKIGGSTFGARRRQPL